MKKPFKKHWVHKDYETSPFVEWLIRIVAIITVIGWIGAYKGWW